MKKIFIVGGAGKVGRRLAQLLATRGHEPRSLYRRAEQAVELKGLGAIPVLGSLQELDVKRLAQLMGGSDVAVFSAGAGGKGGMAMTNAIDGRGLELAVAAARQAGIQRFLLVSAFPESFRGKEISETFENYMSVKKLADVHLAETIWTGSSFVPVRCWTRQGPARFAQGWRSPTARWRATTWPPRCWRSSSSRR